MRTTLLAATGALALTAVLAGPAMACDPDYSGVTLTAGSQTGPFIALAMQMPAKTWEQKTCGKVNVVEFPFGELYPKYLTAMTAGESTFDVITFAPAWMPDFAPYLSEMPAAMQSRARIGTISSPIYRDRLMVWDNKHLFAVDGRRRPHLHLPHGPVRRSRRRRTRSRPSTATTWPRRRPGSNIYDIAEFFSVRTRKLWGTAEAFRRGGQQFWFFFTHAAAYTNDPQTTRAAMFFDPGNDGRPDQQPGLGEARWTTTSSRSKFSSSGRAELLVR
jgi:multiple sugar transport system substrate-binding protein